MKDNIKLGARYVVLVFFMYLAWYTTSPTYLESIKDMPQFVLMTINASVFGALTLVVKSHFSTKIGED